MESMDVKTDNKTLFSITESTGDVEALKLLNSGRTFSQDELDMALLSACHCGYKFLVHQLVHFGADVQAKDRNGNTPLLICAENGFTSIEKFLITRKVDINAANYFGDTALLLAIRPAGSTEMVKLLLAQTGINVNHQNKSGYTALMKAIEVMDIDVIKLLLDSQENTAEVLYEIKNRRNETAHEMADKLGIGTVVKWLPKQGTKVCNPFLAAVLACDVGSFNILMDCQFYESLNRKNFIQDCFREVFAAHGKSGKDFSKDEEKIIQRLLECGADVHEFSDSNPVLVATKVGSNNVLQMLLKHAVRLDELSRWVLKHDSKNSHWRQKGLLVISAEHGHAEIVKMLLEHNPKLAAQDCATPALMNAVKNGHTECIQLLTKYGASLDIKSTFKSAINDNDSVVLKYVVGNLGTEVKRLISPEEMSNFTVSAAREGHVNIIGVLLDAGADVNAVNSENKTPLMESKNADVVNFLVQRGAVVNKKRKGNSPLHSPVTYILSRYYFQPGSADKEKIIEALLQHRASVNGRSCGGRTPLMIAVSNIASRSILQMLLDHGANVTAKDSKGNTVLHIAAEKDSTENMESLLQKTKAKKMINVQNKEGLTALMISTNKCGHKTMKVLIDHGADVNIKDFSGNTALLLAVSKQIQKPEILTALIEAGSDINVQNTSGYTPLMLAAQASLKDAVMLLVDSGANINAVSDKVKNATAFTLMLDNISFKSDCVRYLLDHGAKSSYLKPDVLLRLIQQNDTQFISKLIQSGLVPTEIATSNIQFSSIPVSVTETVSPLCMALMTGNVRLARYFIGNLFVTKSDVFTLFHSQDVRHHLIRNNYPKCVEFLDELSAQPMSLFSLAFLVVQSAVGTGPGREERISVLPLSQVVKDRLLFKVETVPWDLSSSGRPAPVNVGSTYSELMMALESLGNLASLRYEYDDDDDDDDYLDAFDYEYDSSDDDENF
ncbi:hypothetical protein BsWGS_26450 [Bradybaena similaris]